MAEATRTEVAGRCYRHVWNLTTADATGASISIPGASDRTVQLVGTNWGGATCVLEGSCEETPATWFNLTDPQGNAISKTADAGEAVFENTVHIRPRLSVAGSAAVIQVVLVSRSTK